MRIISGKYKGRIIEAVNRARPTQEKVRKALFDILGDISGLSFLELFAGSGAVGFEAVSRGVRDLTLIEYNPGCLRVISKNIESLKLKTCSIYRAEAQRGIKRLHKEKKRFDIIFMDPPYQLGLAKKTLQSLSDCDILAHTGFIIVQHFKKDELPSAEGNLILFRQARYGDTVLSFYKK